MNIGFDLDEIFISHPPLIPSALMRKLYGEHINSTLSYRIPGKLEQYIRRLSHASFLRPPIKKNIEFIKNTYSKKNNHFFLISSRYSFLKIPTENFLQKYNLNKIFQGSFFNYADEQPHEFKNSVIKKLHIKRFVDDDIYLLFFLAKENRNVDFFWLNSDKRGKLLNNLTAITNISQALI